MRIAYECNKKRCPEEGRECHWPDCMRTCDIKYATNFIRISDERYVEKIRPDHLSFDELRDLTLPKWNSFEVRELTDEERAEYPEAEYWIGNPPEEDEPIFVTNGRDIWADELHRDPDYGLFLSEDDIEPGMYWMYVPKIPDEIKVTAYGVKEVIK